MHSHPAAAALLLPLFSPRNNLALFASPADGGAGGPGVSPPMLVAADRLHGLLGALGGALDAVVFRDVWRAVAVTVNYAFFNEVATEAAFTEQVGGTLTASARGYLLSGNRCSGGPGGTRALFRSWAPVAVDFSWAAPAGGRPPGG